MNPAPDKQDPGPDKHEIREDYLRRYEDQTLRAMDSHSTAFGPVRRWFLTFWKWASNWADIDPEGPDEPESDAAALDPDPTGKTAST
jgi:hypothetical protein